MQDPIQYAYDHVAADKQAVLDFFGLFSRFEFALKKSNYVIKGKSFPACDWRRFATKASKDLASHEDAQFLGAVTLLSEHYPKKLLGSMEWDEKTPPHGDNPIEIAVNAVVRVRNNLFHGSKSDMGNQARNTELICASMTVLIACLEVGETKRRYYEQD